MKLEVPDPEQPDPVDPTQLSMELWIGIVVSVMLIFFGWFFWVRPQIEADGDSREEVDTEERREREVQRDRGDFEQMLDSGEAEQFDWSANPDRTARVFEVGPRRAAEVACEDYEDELESGTASRDVTRILRQRVARSAEDLPWACLLRTQLEGRLPEDAALSEELADFWERAATTEQHGEIMRTVVDHSPEQWPDDERFDRWVRRCALAGDYPAGDHCRRALREGGYGDDILEMLIGYIGETTGAAEEVHRELDDDLELAVDALSRFARHGQPESWKITETEQLPDYDVDFRLGSLFMLCRLVNAPVREVRADAISGLRSVAGIADRPASPHVQFRWMRACRRAFGDDPNANQPEAPILAVSIVDDGVRTVDYGLDLLVDEGLCEIEEGFPRWFCGSTRWTGEGRPVRRVMSMYFAQSGYVQWLEPEEYRQVVQ